MARCGFQNPWRRELSTGSSLTGTVKPCSAEQAGQGGKARSLTELGQLLGCPPAPPSGLVHWGRAGEGRPFIIGTPVSSSMPGKSLRSRQNLYSQREAMQLPQASVSSL